MTYPTKFRSGAEEKVCLEQLEKEAAPLDLVLTFYPFQDGADMIAPGNGRECHAK